MKTLDCRGLACPQPVMRTRDALEQGRPQELLVLVDNAAASENVSRFLRRSGFEVSVNQPENALWEVHGLSSATQVEARNRPRPPLRQRTRKAARPWSSSPPIPWAAAMTNWAPA